MAWIRCVLPSPVPPWMNSGLYARPGASTTASAAACAKVFDGPTTKFSKVCRGLSGMPRLQVFSVRRFGGSFSSGAAAGASGAGRVPSTTNTIATFSWPEAPNALRISGR